MKTKDLKNTPLIVLYAPPQKANKWKVLLHNISSSLTGGKRYVGIGMSALLLLQ